MSGAITQLVSSNTGHPNPNFESVMDIITHSCETIRFNQTNRFTISRQCDVIKSIYLKFKMAPLPVGYIYKNCWTLNAFNSIELRIGGMVIWKTNKEKEKMLQLILPQPNRELSFDYNIEERRHKSLYVHETIFELNIKEIFGDTGLPIVGLQFHSIDINLTLSSFENCIDDIRHLYFLEEPPINLSTNYMLECLPQSFGLFLDTPSRNRLSTINQSTFTKNYDIATNVFNSNINNISIDQDGVCTSAYIHITNEDGSEINNQVLDNVKVLLNGNERYNISGFQAKYQMRTLIPHPTRDNNISHNLYYISYNSTYPINQFIESGYENGYGSGLNTSRIDSYKFIFTYSDIIQPQNFKISVIHRSQNTFRINGGMGGYRYTHNNSRILDTNDLMAEIQQQQQQQQQQIQATINSPNYTPAIFTPRSHNSPIFLPSDQIINISNDVSCVITMEPIIENTDIVKCSQCNQICMMEALNEWFKISKTCPHCRASQSNIMFVCAKAHVNS